MNDKSDLDQQKTHTLTTFQQDGYQDTIILLIIMIIIGFGAVAATAYLVVYPLLSVEIPVDKEWRVMQEIPLELSFATVSDVLQWVSQVAPGFYSLDFNQYQQEVELQKIYFTDEGWSNYLLTLRQYPFQQESLQKQKAFITCAPEGAPIIMSQGVLFGRYSWWVQMPVSLRYSNGDK